MMHMGCNNNNDNKSNGNENFLSRCIGWFSRWTSSAAILCLAGVSFTLFLQLQAITYQVATQNERLSRLEKELQQQSTMTEQVSKEVHHSLIQQMAGGFVLLTILVTTFHMTAHLRSFQQPDVQRKIVAILFLPPIYSCASFISLCAPNAQDYMMILKDFYEAYCIYQFLSFLIAVLGRGSREAVVKVLENHGDHLDPPYRCWRCLWGYSNDSPQAKSQAVLMECQALAMQFVFIRPMTAIATFVIQLVGAEEGLNDYDTSLSWAVLLTPWFWILVIENISVFFAFAGLLKFYHAVRDDLQWMQPFAKFLCIKGVVFMTFWQGLLIAVFVYIERGDQTDNESAAPTTSHDTIQNLLICLEMLFFSLAHWCVFPTDEWSEGYRPKVMAVPGIAFGDFVQDVQLVIDHASKGGSRKRTPRGTDQDVSLLSQSSRSAATEGSVLLGGALA